MIYPSEFNHYQSKSKFSEYGKSFRISKIGLHISKSNLKKKLHTKKILHSTSNSEEPIWIRYFNNSTVHGFRYLTDPKIHRTER